jgi:hypothetical protein
MVILTSYDSIMAPKLLEKLEAKGIDKFIAYEIPVDLARQRYGEHFNVVIRDLHETDDLRVLDYNGRRAFDLFELSELTHPLKHEGLMMAVQEN